MISVALYGGAFDPPHAAHVFAVSWLLGAGLDEVWLLPTADHVFGKRMAPFGLRVRMIEAALAAFDPRRVQICTVEAERSGPSRTFDTLAELSAAHRDRRFHLVIGADNLAERHRWHRFDELVERWPVIVFDRPGYSGALAAVADVPWCRAGPALPDVSSTAVRAALGGVGDPGALAWVPEGVRALAADQYQAAGGDRPGPVAVLGQGGAGAALAAALRASGGAVRTWNRSPGRDADATGAELPGWLGACPIWVLAVSDPAIEPLAAALAAGSAPVAGRVVLHLAGRLGAEALAPLALRRAAVGSLHPLQSLRGAASAGRLRGAWFGCEGEPAALAVAEALVAQVGGLVARIPPGEKPAWHAAAVLAANFITPLGAGGQRLLQAIGVPPEAARALLAPLQRGTVERLAEGPAEEALSGPFARGDVAAVAAHVAALGRHGSGPLLEAYRSLARATADWLAWDPAQRQALEAALADPQGP